MNAALALSNGRRPAHFYKALKPGGLERHLQRANPRPQNMQGWLNRLDNKKPHIVSTLRPAPAPAPKGKASKGGGAGSLKRIIGSFFDSIEEMFPPCQGGQRPSTVMSSMSIGGRRKPDPE